MYNKNLKYTSKESLFVIMAFVCMFAMIVITSVANAGLDPEKIFTVKNFSNVLINASITIFGVVASIPSGSTSTKQKVNPDGTKGRYLQEFSAYNTIRAKIEKKRFKFSQWHHKQFLAENREKRVNYLLGKGIFQADEILDLSREQISALTTSQTFVVDGVQKYFKALSAAQIIAALRVYDGKVLVHKLPDFYFLYIDGKGRRSFYDQAYYQQQDERFTLFSKLIFKIFIGFLVTTIFTSLVIEYKSTDIYDAAFVFGIILTILTRTFNAISSTFWGFLIGQEAVYKQCYYINGKTQFLQSFDTDDDFEYKDIQTIAKEEYLKSNRKESEHGRSNDTDTDTDVTNPVEEPSNILA